MYKGRLKFDKNVDSAALAAHLADSLRRANARKVKVDQNRVSFTAGIFRLLSYGSFLVQIGFGDLTVDSAARQIEYRLSFRQLLLGATISAGFLAGAIRYDSGSWELIRMVPLMWLFLVGFSFVLGLSRFDDFLCRTLKTAPRLKG